MTSQPGHAGVVVGVDGSPESYTAVSLAAREAALRGAALTVVHGLLEPYVQILAEPPTTGALAGELSQRAQRIVADAVARARAEIPVIDVDGEVISASGAEALIRRSHDASLIVVGDRGLGAFSGLLIGSVAVHLASHATCPVLIARGATDPALPVLLAADGSPANNPAVGFAFQEAALRGAPVFALHVWPHPASGSQSEMQPLGYNETRVDEEERVLSTALAGWEERYPELPVRHWVMHGRTRKTIIDATHEAQLVVLGARGRGGFAGLLLGSVSQAVLRHAACPTTIVPQRHRG